MVDRDPAGGQRIRAPRWDRWARPLVVLLGLGAFLTEAPAAWGLKLRPPPPPPLRFTFSIPQGTPQAELLPVAPKARVPAGPLLDDDLAKVPEVAFEAPQPRRKPSKEASEAEAMRAAYTLARINHVNKRATDGYLKALLAERPDLSGLPFAMGDDCRIGAEKALAFARALVFVRSGHTLLDDGASALALEARVGALMQIGLGEDVKDRLRLVRSLAGIPHPESSRALARLAIFSPEAGVRNAALRSLKVRRERDYTQVLLNGLSYPMPAVARRAADAVAKLERTDLLSQLVAVLDAPDPRAPKVEEVGGKKVPVVREVVKINHHRNCVLCHAPSTSGDNPSAFDAQVPLPTEPLPSAERGYGNTLPDLLVRIDVTYLRQDFSAMLPVADQGPWPAMQRFDFLVRKRTLTEDQARTYRAALAPRAEGEVSPNHRAALLALRELTGKDAAPTADAWRRLLKLPSPS